MKKNHLLISRSAVIRAFLLAVLLILAAGYSCLAMENAYIEPFGTNYQENGWNLNVFIGNPYADYISVNSQRMAFTLPLSDTYLLLTNEQTVTDNSSVEAVFENILSLDAAYGVICRYSDKGWYELRINISGPQAGSFFIVKYDPARKAKFLNPYVEIHPGMTQIFTSDIKLGLNVENKIRLDCSGENFKVTINDRPQNQYQGGVFTDAQFSEGAAGVTVQAHQTGSVKIDLNEFNVHGEDLPLYDLSSGDSLMAEIAPAPELMDAPANGDADIANLNQTIAALEALLNSQAATPELPPAVMPAPLAPPPPTPAAPLMPETVPPEPEENDPAAGQPQTLLPLSRMARRQSDSRENPPTEIPAEEQTAMEQPVINLEIESLNQTLSALKSMTKAQEATPEPAVPTEIPILQIETTDIGSVAMGQNVDCAQKFSLQIIYQPVMTGAVSGERANGKFLYFRAKVTNNTAEDVFIPIRMFRLESPSGAMFPLDLYTSTKTADQWDLDYLAKPVPSGKSIDTFLVFDTSGEKGSWRMLFEPILRAQEGPLCSIRFTLPAANYLD